jgi:hypothetical protein
MNNHYSGVYFNFLLFSKFSDAVDRCPEIDKGDKAKQAYNHITDLRILFMTSENLLVGK